MNAEEKKTNEEEAQRLADAEEIEVEVMPDNAAEESVADEPVAAADAEPADTGRKGRKKRAERQLDEANQKVEEMGKKLAEINDKYMRVYSEYENYRKRTSAEKAELILNGGKDVIKTMLPVLDDMERALANMVDGDTAKEGMQLIYKNMMNALQQKGLKADGGGIFQSSWHSYSPWSAVTAFSAEDGEKWGEASFPCYPLNSVAEE